MPSRRELVELGRSFRLARELRERERWPLERLRRHQQARLDALVRHAAERSPFYRERVGDALGSGPVELERLPTLEKDEMMDRYDDLVTDDRLRRDDLLEWLEGPGAGGLYADRFRVMTTSGSSGRKGLFAYDPEGWRSIVAQFLRFNEWCGIRPRLPRRLRIAAVIAASPMHMSRQVTATLSVGIHRVLTLAATAPARDTVAALNRFQPDVLSSYPSAVVGLVEEQLAGRLRISPRITMTSSELRTPEITARMIEAFGVEPFDVYGTTEGLWASDCEHHRGIHLYEDSTLVENVDEDGTPVPPGRTGARLLVTNLDNRVQPIIRLGVADAVTIDPEPCPCGRRLARMRSVEGRSDDVLELDGSGGRRVRVHPLRFAPIARDRTVREFQVLSEADRLRVLVVPVDGSVPGVEDRVRDAVTGSLADLGVADPRVEVEVRPRLERGPGGKLQIVVDRTR